MDMEILREGLENKKPLQVLPVRVLIEKPAVGEGIEPSRGS